MSRPRRSLATAEREHIVRRHFEGARLSEIARELTRNPNTILSYLQKIRAAGVKIPKQRPKKHRRKNPTPPQPKPTPPPVARPKRERPNRAARRTCLRCDTQFDSRGPGNRFCEPCTEINTRVMREHSPRHFEKPL